VACHTTVYVQFKVLLYLAICAQQVLISRVSTALHVHGCTAVHSCHLKSCYDSLLVIVIIRAQTAETIYGTVWAEPMTMPCIVPDQPLLLGLLHVYTTIGLDLSASVGGIVSCLFLVGACSGFFSLGWALINCQLFLDVLLGVSMLPEPIGSAHIVVVCCCR